MVQINDVFRTGLEIWMAMDDFHFALLVFGLSVVLVFSIIYLVKHVKNGKVTPP